MNSPDQEQTNHSSQGDTDSTKASSNLRKNTRPPLPETYKQLCDLCRKGKLFAVQDWFKTHKFEEPAGCSSKHWPLGIAIDSGFHSMVEVLLQNGVPARDGLDWAVGCRNKDLVELLFQYGANSTDVDFNNVVHYGNVDLIRLFIERGADLVTGYPIAHGLIKLTKPFLGIYKSCIAEHPELQFQADMALRHFCEEGSLRGVSLLMWLGANPRAKVPKDEEESDEMWQSPLQTAVYQGDLNIIRRLQPNPEQDDLQFLLSCSLLNRSMTLVRYFVSLGADINSRDECGELLHDRVIWGFSMDLDSKRWSSYSSRASDGKRFAFEWFSSGVKWVPRKDDYRSLRKIFSRLSYMEAYEFIKLLRVNDVIPADILAEVLDTPKLKAHLHDRRGAISVHVPILQKWLTPQDRVKLHRMRGIIK